MTTSLSKLQLDTVLSALDGQRRNPSSREIALKRIGRHAGTLQLALDELLTAASGLLDGRMDAAAFLASLRHERPAADDAPVELAAEVADAERAETMHGDADTIQPTHGDTAADGTVCPTCGRRLRAGQTPGARQPRGHRDGSKEAQVIEMLRRPQGATIAQIMAATGWRAHTVRGVFAGALKKRRGLAVTSAKPQGGERIYRIA